MKKRKHKKAKAPIVSTGAFIGKRAKRRARGKRRQFSIEQKAARYALFDNTCAYCGVGGKMTADHFIPLATGGAAVDRISNIIPACSRCNGDKGCLEAFSWYSRQPYYTEERWDKIKNVLNNDY